MGEVSSAVAAIRAGLAELQAASLDELSHRELISLLDELKTLSWSFPTLEHDVLARLMAETEPKTLGAKSWTDLLTVALRLSRGESRRRVRHAQTLGPRRAISGEQLAPHWPATAAAQAQGRIGAAHVDTIARFFDKLPHWVDIDTRTHAETQLAELACGLDPDQLGKAAERLLVTIDPDGPMPDDAEQARRRGIVVGKQQPDGMSPIRGHLTPEARAHWEAAAAKLAAPGSCNPDDDTPCMDGEPSTEQRRGDTRSQSQRNHDAFLALTRSAIASGQLGQHNGLPVTVIVSTTLQELQEGAGVAVTGGGSLLPMRDLIRMAAHAHHYLAVFDQHTNHALYLGRSKRIASPGQRIMLHARDRGCTRPGCTAPGYWTQAHHAVTDWANGGHTNIDDMTLACPPDNRAATNGGWTTRKRPDGRIEWLPPPALDTGQARVNNYHHPQRYLLPDDPPDDDPQDRGLCCDDLAGDAADP